MTAHQMSEPVLLATRATRAAATSGAGRSGAAGVEEVVCHEGGEGGGRRDERERLAPCAARAAGPLRASSGRQRQASITTSTHA